MSEIEDIINLVERHFDVDDQDSWGVDGDKAREELYTLRATVAAMTAERDAAYRRGWDAARDAAAVCVAGDWRLRDKSGAYHEINLECVSDTIMTLQPTTEHDAAMLEAWNERL